MKFELVIQSNTLTPQQFNDWVMWQAHCTLEHGSNAVENNEYVAWICPHSFEDAEGFGNAVAELMKASIEGIDHD